MARILLIDDQRIFLDRARTLLRSDAHDLIEANDALAGLHRAVEEMPDCVVVDLALTGLDGLEICRRLARDAATRDVPVVVWGALAADRAAPLAREAGAFAYVDRERSAAALRGTVRRALDESRSVPDRSTARRRSPKPKLSGQRPLASPAPGASPAPPRSTR
jgi:CheY-like chemotaxis protein